MKKLIFTIISLFLIQLTVFAQDKMNYFPENNTKLDTIHSLDYYRGDTVILIDSTVHYRFTDEVAIPISKTWYKERDSEGRKFININYSWDNINNTYRPSSKDSILYYNDNSIKEKFTKSYDRIMNNWKHSAYVSYNSEGLPLVEESLNWDSTIGQYYLGNKIISTYSNDSLIISEQTNIYDTATNDWQNKQLLEYERNDFGNIVLSQTKDFDVINSNWVFVEKTEYVRNGNSIITKRTKSTFSKTLNEWMYVDKQEYFLDNHDNDTLSISSTWDEDTSSWRNNLKTIKLFNENNMIVLDLDNLWSDDLNDWYLDNKIENYYNTFGEIDTIIRSKWYREYEFWYGTSKQFRYYNENKVLIYVLNQGYDLVYEYWYNRSRVMWEYEIGYDVFIIDEWENNAWYGRSRTENTFNEQGKLVLQMGYRRGTVETGWDIIFRTNITYGEHGGRLMSQSESNYYNAGWVLGSKSYYYYSEYILPSAIPEYNQIEFKVYPNPCNKQLNLEFENLNNEKVEFKIYSILGKVVDEGILDPVDINSINVSHLENGFYMIQAISGKKKYSGKFIKF